MSSERSPVTHPANYDNKNFWQHLDKDKKKEFLHVDTLYNRQFLETSRSLIFGSLAGLAFSLIFMRIRNRFGLAALTSGLSCAVLCNMKGSTVHNQYFKVWDAVKNDQVIFDTIKDSTEKMSNDEFHYFYHRYLKFFYPQLNENSDEKSESK